MSDRAQPTLLWIVAVLLVGGTALALQFVRGYRPLAGLSAPTSPLPPNVAIRFSNVRVVGRAANRPAWTLHAERIDTTPARDRLTFAGSVTGSLIEAGRPGATIQADGAVYDTVRRDLTASGHIVCRVLDKKSGQTRVQITGPDLEWQVDGHTVHSDGPVRATSGPGDTVVGSQLDLDLRNRNLTMKNIEATYSVQDDNPADALPSLSSLKP